MKGRVIAWWTATALVALELLAGSVLDLSRFHLPVEILTRLHYPLYLLVILGTWKLLAVPAILMPGYPRLKEWTYAGVFFLTTGAIASHAICGDGKGLVSPAIFLLLAMISWGLRTGSHAWVSSAAAEAGA